MARVLLLFSTTDGHTIRICERLKRVLEDHGHHATVVSIDGYSADDLSAFDKIIIGASIRYGRHSPEVFRFIDRHLSSLESKPNAFFSVNIVARKPAKNDPESNPYVRKFLKQTAWRPRQLGVFAGRLDYPKYGILDRFMIRLIMFITKGPTDITMAYEFTDWEKVQAFGALVSKM